MPEDLTMMPADDADEQRLRDTLRALPLEAPSRSALPALELQLARRRRQRATRRWLPLAVAATVCMLALLPLLRGGLTQVEPTAIDDVASASSTTAALIAQNQVYEAALRSAAFSGRSLSGQDAMAGAQIEDLIGMLDLELSAARDPDGTEALWLQRLQLMQELAALRASSGTDMRTAANLDLQPATYRLN